MVQFGSTSVLGTEGRRFESCYSDQKKLGVDKISKKIINEYTQICTFCNKIIYEHPSVTPICEDCKTIERIYYWGDPFFDYEEINKELVGDNPHNDYWLEYKKYADIVQWQNFRFPI